MEQKEEIITISLKDFFKVIWKEKIIVVTITSLFIGLGVYIAFTKQEQFTASGRILPEFETKGGGLSQFAGLASLAGISLDKASGGEAIRPDLYPDILKSIPFFNTLFEFEVVTRDNQKMTFSQFYDKVIDQGKEVDPKKLDLFKIKPNGYIIQNQLKEERIEALKERITAVIDKKSGVITITVKMPDPIVAAQITKFSMDYLTEYVTDYRTVKAKKDVDFLAEKVAAARGKFYTKQSQKAQYADQFQAPTIRLQSADIQRERIESEYRISSSFYNELLKKYEEAKIKLQQETPVFQILEPPVAPTKKSEPKKAVILLAFAVVGGIVSTIMALLVRKNYKQVFQS